MMFSFKSATRTLAAAAMAIALGTTGSIAQQEVIWWDYSGGGDGVRLKALFERFNQEHAGEISINATTLEWGTPYYSKIQTSAAIGNASDIALYHLARIPTGVSTGVLSEITDEDLATMGLSKSDFDPAQIEAASVNGKLYAIPFDLHPIVLYYNEDKLRDAGLLDANGRPTGLDGAENFESALRKLMEGGTRYGLSTPLADSGHNWRLFYSLFNQNGGLFFDGSEFLPGENAQKAVEAISVVSSWVEEGLTPAHSEYVTSIGLFTSGEASMHINGVWELPTFVDLKKKGQLFNFGAAVLPGLLGEQKTWFDGTSFVIPNNANKPITPEKKQAVLKVIGWFVNHSLDWADAGYIIPYLPVSDEVAKLEPQSFYSMFPDLVRSAVFDPQTPLAGPANPIYDAVGDYIMPAHNGDMDAAEAVQEMKTRLDEMQAELQ
jgi:multiple sugar transport system substrate-binding protein